MSIHMRAITALTAATLLSAASVQAQNEYVLRTAFEGRLVSVKVGMPGTSKGIDVFPLEAAPVDWREVAERIKDYGTSLKVGDQVMITKVVVKSNSHIEFQLGGGGWGTFLDSPGTSSVSSTSEGESKYERALRDSIKAAPGPTRRKQLERELNNARQQRERDNANARAQAQQANALHEANLRAKREQSGSRFNIRFRNGIPSEHLTPEGVRVALAEYVDFAASGAKVSAAQGGAAGALSAATTAPNASDGGSALSRLRKGLLVKEVEDLLGPADTAGEQKEGTLTLVKRSYTKDGMKVAASFINGVMIDFSITPR
ncbi:MAG: hypothetical protein ACT4P7_06635 [Gemmatimonadaceae bacterium]